jgi:hypothetical protein
VLVKLDDPASVALFARASGGYWKLVNAMYPPSTAEKGQRPSTPFKVKDFVRSIPLLAWAAANTTIANAGAKVCSQAALGGHLEVLKWARARNFPWDARTLDGAAKKGHLELMQWARANGCPWDERTYSWARVSGNVELTEWMKANGCPYSLRIGDE